MTSFDKLIQREVRTIEESLALNLAARVFYQVKMRCLFVKNRNDQVVGIITQSDFISRGLVAEDCIYRRAGQIMSYPLIAATEGESLEGVLELMRCSGFVRIPILKENPRFQGELAGVVGLDQILGVVDISPVIVIQILRARCIKKERKIRSKLERLQVRRRNRSESHQIQTLIRFYRHFEEELNVSPDVLPHLIYTVLSVLCRRVSYATSSGFIAQLPRLLQKRLLELPAGPDSQYSGRRLIEDVSQSCRICEYQACGVVMGILRKLSDWMGPDSLSKLGAELPHEYQPFFRSAQELSRIGVQRERLRRKM